MTRPGLRPQFAKGKAASTESADKDKRPEKSGTTGEPNGPGSKSQVQFKKVALHSIVFFPIDYDDPASHAFPLASGAHVDSALSTGLPTFLIRNPPVSPGYQPYFARDQLPSYFQKPIFDRVERRLRYTYLEGDGNKVVKPSYANRDAQTGGSVKILHQWAVFFELLREEPHNFKSIYAGNLYTALRHAKRLTGEIARQNPKSPSLTKTPISATTTTSSLDPYKNHQSPVSPGGSKKKKDGYYQERVMLFNYRESSNVLGIARANLALMHEDVLVYPSLSELGWESAKTYDILALEAINEKRPNTWRPKSHVCDLTNDPENYVCDLKENHQDRYQGKDQMLKRSHSSCAEHVRYYGWQEWKNEGRCWGAVQKWREKLAKLDVILNVDIREPESPNTSRGDTGIPHIEKRFAVTDNVDFGLEASRFYSYIHEEFVPCFSQWGELRVFIATRYIQDKNGVDTDEREPYVVEIIKTRFWNLDKEKKKFKKDLKTELERRKSEAVPGAVPFSEDDDVIVVENENVEGSNSTGNGANVPLIRCTYSNENLTVTRYNLDSLEHFEKPYDKFNLPAVKKYALAQFRRLLRRFPRNFKSFDVGTRMDIGIGGPKDTCTSLFINEVTRWWWASWFCSYDDLNRQADVPRAFAKSFAEVYASAAVNYGADNDEDGNDSADDEFYDDMMDKKDVNGKRKAPAGKEEKDKKRKKNEQQQPQPQQQQQPGPPAGPATGPPATPAAASAPAPAVKEGRAPLTDDLMVALRDTRRWENLLKSEMYSYLEARTGKTYKKAPQPETVIKEIKKYLKDAGL